MSEAVLKASGVSKTYQMAGQPLTVLTDVDLELERGEFVALQGASGSGKSTLLQLLGGLDAPSEGGVIFKGKSVQHQTPKAAAIFRGLHIGFVFQAYHLLPDLDALENVCLPAQVQRAPQAKAEARARELLDAVGLANRVTHLPAELSGGEQQRVAVARALSQNTKLVLADEPTGNLDARTGETIFKLLHTLNQKRGTAFIIVTHNERLYKQAERLIRMVDGKIENGEGA